MRERITFIQKPGDAVDPASLKLAGGLINGPDLHAIREDRLTLALDEVPKELQELLEEAHELHIRWASQHVHESVGPLFSRLPPGFHLFYTPRQETAKDS
jgi:hypothetical protein